MDYETLQELYDSDGYYWGTEPNSLAETTLEYVDGDTHSRLVDIGAGEGRDSVFFAEQGFDVLAIDIAPNGLEKAERLADERGVTVDTTAADVNDVTLPDSIDIAYSIGTLQYIRPQHRPSRFEHFQERTKAGGVHSLFAFVDHPDVDQAPDWGENEYLYERDELQRQYEHWETLHTEEFVFDCESGSVPHQHAARVLVARK